MRWARDLKTSVKCTGGASNKDNSQSGKNRGKTRACQGCGASAPLPWPSRASKKNCFGALGAAGRLEVAGTLRAAENYVGAIMHLLGYPRCSYSYVSTC